MKRTLLGLALAAAALAPAPASAIGPTLCGGTFQPECDICYEDTWQRICLPVTFGPGS